MNIAKPANFLHAIATGQIRGIEEKTFLAQWPGPITPGASK
jgi:hypothetical protein